METQGAGWLGQIDRAISQWHLLQHPFYQDWQAGRLDRGTLQLYAAQYYRHVEAFPHHLERLAARTDGPLHELIQENLAEELDPQRTHPQLWREFAAAVGVSDSDLDGSRALPGVQTLVNTYRTICSERSPVEAVCALYAYECQVPEIATQKMDGLLRFYGVNDAKGLAYFAVHEEADQRHRAAWRDWLAQHNRQSSHQENDAVQTTTEALRALWGALDAVHNSHA